MLEVVAGPQALAWEGKARQGKDRAGRLLGAAWDVSIAYPDQRGCLATELAAYRVGGVLAGKVSAPKDGAIPRAIPG